MEIIRKVDGVCTKEYAAWKAMKARCYCKCNADIGMYQKNKINVCKEWINSYEHFIEDMGLAPNNESSLDRVDNYKNYCKENCRWASKEEQCKNRGSFNVLIEYKGQTKVMKDWAKYFNINYTTLRHRLKVLNLSLEEAIKYKRIYKKKHKQDMV